MTLLSAGLEAAGIGFIDHKTESLGGRLRQPK